MGINGELASSFQKISVQCLLTLAARNPAAVWPGGGSSRRKRAATGAKPVISADEASRARHRYQRCEREPGEEREKPEEGDGEEAPVVPAK
jgi:hypothetical protein